MSGKRLLGLPTSDHLARGVGYGAYRRDVLLGIQIISHDRCDQNLRALGIHVSGCEVNARRSVISWRDGNGVQHQQVNIAVQPAADGEGHLREAGCRAT